MFEFRINHDPSTDDLHLRGFDRVTGTGILPIACQHFDRGMVMEPFLALSRSEAQNLVDALYKTGLKPTNFKDDSIAAHLEDMRAIAFHQLGVTKP